MASLPQTLLLCLLLFNSILTVFCQRNASSIIRAISKHADKRVRPNGDSDGKVHVTISMHIIDMNINDKTLDYTLDAYLRLFWRDDRLKYTDQMDLVLTPFIADQFLWKPDVFFVNAHENFMRSEKLPTYGARLQPNGDVLYSTKVTLHSKCSSSFKKYPMDTHNCSLYVESYMLPMQDVQLIWKDVSAVTFNKDSNVQFFTLTTHGTSETHDVLSTGTYQRLTFWFTLNRNSRSMMTMSVLPSFLLVCLSCLLFWLPLCALTERTIFSTMLLLIVTVIAVTSRQGAPPAPYLTLLDTWLLGCFLFLVFATLEVIALVLVSTRFYTKRDTFELVDDDVRASSSEDVAIKPANHNLVQPQLIKKVDLTMRILYPAAFILFSVVYFGVLAT